MSDSHQSDEFPLADLIHALSEQLRRSESRASELINSGGRPLIAWTNAQIEVGVTWTRDVNGEIDIKVLRLGGQRTKENTATMTVTLKPVDGGRQEPGGGGGHEVDEPLRWQPQFPTVLPPPAL
jgi:hypothetical protein